MSFKVGVGVQEYGCLALGDLAMNEWFSLSCDWWSVLLSNNL